jgi:ketosteroid isomerase-like protein
MSQENVEIVRRMVEFANLRDVEGITALMSPDIECFPAAEQPEAEGFCGREAFTEYVNEWLLAFDEYEMVVSEYLDLGEYVVAVGRVTGHGRESGATVSDAEAWLYRFRDGMAVEYRECGTKAKALEAAGLSE